MINVAKFLLFILYTTSIFFLPNDLIFIAIILNIFVWILSKTNLKKVTSKTLKILPFVIFTFLINVLLDDVINAIWMAVKLIVVCNITIIYSETTSIFSIAETIEVLCMPLKIFKINTEEIKIMVCVSLSMIPILLKDLSEVKESCRARNIEFNIKNTKIILTKFFMSVIKRVNDLEEALRAKGYEN